MKQDSRSPEQNRSLYPLPPSPPDIESRVCIHKATFRKKINFKTDSFLRLFTGIILGTYWCLHDSFKSWLSTSYIGGFYPSYMALRRRGQGGMGG